jgi:hypothetical protein
MEVTEMALQSDVLEKLKEVIRKESNSPAKKKQLQEILDGTEEMIDVVEANRQYASMSANQRDALHALIKEYSRAIPDDETRLELLKKAQKEVK